MWREGEQWCWTQELGRKEGASISALLGLWKAQVCLHNIQQTTAKNSKKNPNKQRQQKPNQKTDEKLKQKPSQKPKHNSSKANQRPTKVKQNQLIFSFGFQWTSSCDAHFGGTAPLLYSSFLCGEHRCFCPRTPFTHTTGPLAESSVIFPVRWARLLLSASALYTDRCSHWEVELVRS